MDYKSNVEGLSELAQNGLLQSLAPGYWYVCFLTVDGQEVIMRHYVDEESAEAMAAVLRDALKESPHNDVLVVAPDADALCLNGGGAPIG